MRRVTLVIAFVALAAAASGADGPPPVNPGPAVDAHLQTVLKDPYSAVKRQTSPVFRASFKVPVAKKQPLIYPWAVCYVINAKNSFGGYVGERVYLFLLRDDGSILTSLPSGGVGGSLSDLEGYAARKECGKAPSLQPPAASGEFTVPATSNAGTAPSSGPLRH